MRTRNVCVCVWQCDLVAHMQMTWKRFWYFFLFFFLLSASFCCWSRDNWPFYCFDIIESSVIFIAAFFLPSISRRASALPIILRSFCGFLYFRFIYFRNHFDWVSNQLKFHCAWHWTARLILLENTKIACQMQIDFDDKNKRTGKAQNKIEFRKAYLAFLVGCAHSAPIAHFIWHSMKAPGEEKTRTKNHMKYYIEISIGFRFVSILCVSLSRSGSAYGVALRE